MGKLLRGYTSTHTQHLLQSLYKKVLQYKFSSFYFTNSVLFNHSMESHIKNIKIAVYLQENFCQPIKSRQKMFFRINNLHITLYKHSPSLLNVTGVKSLCKIEDTMQLVENFFKIKIIEYKINCIMLSEKTKTRLKLEEIPGILPTLSNQFLFDYNPEIFSAAFLKPYQNNKLPTILMFFNGTIQIFAKDTQMLSLGYSITQSIFSKVSLKHNHLML